MSFKIKKINKQLTKGLLDIVILGFLKSGSMHGYKMITTIRKDFGVYFGPSTMYPHLNELEKKGLIKSQWEITRGRPRKIFNITTEGFSTLTGSEHTFNQICNKLNNLELKKITYKCIIPR